MIYYTSLYAPLTTTIFCTILYTIQYYTLYRISTIWSPGLRQDFLRTGAGWRAAVGYLHTQPHACRYEVDCSTTVHITWLPIQSGDILYLFFVV